MRAAVTVYYYLHVSVAGLPWERLFTPAAQQKSGQTISKILIFFFLIQVPWCNGAISTFPSGLLSATRHGEAGMHLLHPLSITLKLNMLPNSHCRVQRGVMDNATGYWIYSTLRAGLCKGAGGRVRAWACSLAQALSLALQGGKGIRLFCSLQQPRLLSLNQGNY